MDVNQKELVKAYRLGFVSPWTGSIQNWCMANVSLPVGYNPPGSFDVSRSPYMVEPFNALNDPNTRQVNIMASPRSGKTLLGECFMLYCIANNPSTLLWVQQTEEQTEKMSNLRMSQIIHTCKPVEDLIDPALRYSITKKRFSFTNNMNVIIGSAKIADLQSVGYRYIVGDECWQWEEGFMAEAHARTGDFPNCSKELYISQGGYVGQEWYQEFERGLIYEWGWVCPKCNKEQIYHWNHKRDDGKYAGLQWSSTACKDGIWNLEAAGKSARLVCVHCLNEITDTVNNRYKLLNSGKYLLTKPNGFKQVKSFRWNALANPNVKWSTLVEEFLFAREQVKIHNDLPLEKFDQKRLAICYGEKRNEITIDLNIEEYDTNVDRPNTVRFMTIDIQETSPHLWWLIREWERGTSESRLVAFGNVSTWSEIETIRVNHRVSVNNVLVDSGYDTKDIYTICAKSGKWGKVAGKQIWLSYLATKGTPSAGFRHIVNGEAIWRFYTPIEIKAVNFGNDPKYKGVKGCPYVAFSANRYKNILSSLIRGTGPKWVTNKDDPIYKQHMNSERPITQYKNGKKEIVWEKYDPKGRNEYLDLEVLQVLASNMSGILKTEKEVKEDTDATQEPQTRQSTE